MTGTPRGNYARALDAVTGQPIENLGFRADADRGGVNRRQALGMAGAAAALGWATADDKTARGPLTGIWRSRYEFVSSSRGGETFASSHCVVLIQPGMTTQQPWPWPETMDALLAAPASHRVLLENDRVRVLEVAIEPRTREPGHTRQEVSVMIIEEPARIRYYAGGTLRFESQARSGSPPGVRVRWMEPEGPRSVENTGEHRYHAIRVELR